MSSEDIKQQLKKLTAEFPETEISWLPKPTKAQTEAVAKDFRVGIRCDICSAWHHPQVVHLAYVGHAAVTKRILDVDHAWDWDFLQKNELGGPVFDADGGLWITLTILGVTRKGYGSADGKKGPNATKEIIGDAIRNAGMRFGIALELWHKGEFEKADIPADDGIKTITEEKPLISNSGLNKCIAKIESGELTIEKLMENRKLTFAQLAAIDDWVSGAPWVDLEDAQ